MDAARPPPKLYMPRGQAVHTADEVACHTFAYEPPGHAVHHVAPESNEARRQPSLHAVVPAGGASHPHVGPARGPKNAYGHPQFATFPQFEKVVPFRVGAHPVRVSHCALQAATVAEK